VESSTAPGAGADGGGPEGSGDPVLSAPRSTVPRMSFVTENQPDGTPTWIDLGVPDLDRAMSFYGSLFGWEFAVGPPEYGHYTTCLLDGRRVAALAPQDDPQATEFWWNVYLATGDLDATVIRAVDAGGEVVGGPFDIPGQGRGAMLRDAVGALFGLWQGSGHVGCEVVNEPGALVRNDLVTPTPEPARAFYAAVFDFTLDANADMPEADFTFLRRPDGHEVGGVLGQPAAAGSAWSTVFEVADADDTVRRATAAGGKAAEPTELPYGRIAAVTDPFGTEFLVIARAAR
jgi:predicted enzyme related to lactoylglutathione lyase